MLGFMNFPVGSTPRMKLNFLGTLEFLQVNHEISY